MTMPKEAKEAWFAKFDKALEPFLPDAGAPPTETIQYDPEMWALGVEYFFTVVRQRLLWGDLSIPPYCRTCGPMSRVDAVPGDRGPPHYPHQFESDTLASDRCMCGHVSDEHFPGVWDEKHPFYKPLEVAVRVKGQFLEENNVAWAILFMEFLGGYVQRIQTFLKVKRPEEVPGH